jgi:hypothetical protein
MFDLGEMIRQQESFGSLGAHMDRWRKPAGLLEEQWSLNRVTVPNRKAHGMPIGPVTPTQPARRAKNPGPNGVSGQSPVRATLSRYLGI